MYICLRSVALISLDLQSYSLAALHSTPGSILTQARNQGGFEGSDEPPILTSFLLEPGMCITT